VPQAIASSSTSAHGSSHSIREEERAGAAEQPHLLVRAHLAEELDAVSEVRPDSLFEERVLDRLADLRGDHERQPRGSRDRDRPVRSLRRVDAAEEEQVVLRRGRERVGREVEAVRTVRDPRQVGREALLVQADGDERERRVDARRASEDRARLGLERALDRVHGRRATNAGQRGAGEPDQVVHEVELVRALEASERVVQLGRDGAEAVARGAPVRRAERRLRGGVARGEEGDVVAALDEAVREHRHDQLDPAVAVRRDGEPHRSEEGDLHVPAGLTRGNCRRVRARGLEPLGASLPNGT
jgi:hypothetical protein